MISTAIQKGNFIYIYNEKNSQCGNISGGQLVGFTSTTVSVQKGGFIYVYDEKGHQKSCHSAR